jgi:uncharacterized membrane protein YcaP (DUF421 family)
MVVFLLLGQIITTQAYADELKTVQVCFLFLVACAVCAGVDCLYRTNA